VSNNSLHDGKTDGIRCQEGGAGHLTGNTIYSNFGAGIDVRTESRPTVIGNTVRDGKGDGIHVSTSAMGTFTNNNVSKNPVGMVVQSQANPEVRLLMVLCCGSSTFPGF
jgi:parallel beta-helix repeat protein